MYRYNTDRFSFARRECIQQEHRPSEVQLNRSIFDFGRVATIENCQMNQIRIPNLEKEKCSFSYARIDPPPSGPTLRKLYIKFYTVRIPRYENRLKNFLESFHYTAVNLTLRSKRGNPTGGASYIPYDMQSGPNYITIDI